MVEIVRKDELFYRNSGGGVTASGGEPTYQPDFLKELLRQCHGHGLHTTLDTCGYTKWEIMAEVMEYVDLFYYDLKHLNVEKHQQFTGVSNERILDNARRISVSGKPIVIRVPIIPGCNDSGDNIAAIAEFVRTIDVVRVDILPFHQFGSKKYERLGLVYRLGEAKPYEESEIQAVVDRFRSYGVEVTVA